MKARIFPVVGVLVLCCLGLATAQDSEAVTKSYIFLGITGSFTYPQHETNYQNYYGGGISLGINYDTANGVYGTKNYLAWSNDQFKISGGGFGVLNSYHFCHEEYVYFFSSGFSGGFSRFSIPDDAFVRLGNSTGTELRGENHYNQLSYSTDMGLRFPLRIFSVDCDYHLVTVERAWMFWH